MKLYSSAASAYGCTTAIWTTAACGDDRTTIIMHIIQPQQPLKIKIIIYLNPLKTYSKHKYNK